MASAIPDAPKPEPTQSDSGRVALDSVVAPPDAVLPDRHPEAPAPGELIPSHYHRCFGCGDVDTGLHLHVTAGEGLTIMAKFTVSEDHQGAPGLAHGGLLTAAFDETLGSLSWLLHRPMVTGRLETEFVRPVAVGSTLHITARVDGLLGRKIYTSAVGRLNASDGPVAVRVAALFVIVDLAHFRRHGRREDIKAAVAHPGVQAARRAFEVNP